MKTELDLPRVAQTLDYTCGAACFESMYQFLRGESLGEMHFAKLLGALDLGYTPIENVAVLAKKYGFFCEMKKGACWADVEKTFAEGKVVFVTWWDEDAGHYSLVKSLGKDFIVLMDPWLAREGLDKKLSLPDFILNWEARGKVVISVSN